MPGSRALWAWVRRLIRPSTWRWRASGSMRGAGLLGVGHGEEVEDQRQVVAEALVEEEQLAGDPLARRLVGVPLA